MILSLKWGGFFPNLFCCSGGIESYTIVIYSLFRALLEGGPLYSIGFPPEFRGTLEGISVAPLTTETTCDRFAPKLTAYHSGSGALNYFGFFLFVISSVFLIFRAICKRTILGA